MGKPHSQAVEHGEASFPSCRTWSCLILKPVKLGAPLFLQLLILLHKAGEVPVNML